VQTAQGERGRLGQLARIDIETAPGLGQPPRSGEAPRPRHSRQRATAEAAMARTKRALSMVDGSRSSSASPQRSARGNPPVALPWRSIQPTKHSSLSLAPTKTHALPRFDPSRGWLRRRLVPVAVQRSRVSRRAPHQRLCTALAHLSLLACSVCGVDDVCSCFVGFRGADCSERAW
jgi:hypothetical protein